MKFYNPINIDFARHFFWWVAWAVVLIALAFAVLPILLYFGRLPPQFPEVKLANWLEAVPYYANIVQVLSIALAVIFYLAQSASNRKAESGRGLANILRTYGEYLNACLQNPDLDVFDGQGLQVPGAFWQKKSYNQKRRILIVESIYINVIERFFLWAEAGGREDSPDEYNSWMVHLRQLFKNPKENLPQAWECMHSRYDKKFQEFVENELKSRGC